MKALALALFFVGAVHAKDAPKTSRQLAKQATRSWAAFECSHLAFLAKEEELAQKLLKLGHECGKEFMEATLAGKIERDDYKAEVPMVFGLLNVGPSTEFVLGRVYQASEKAADKLLHDNLELDLAEVAKLAKDELRRRNAELLLKD